MAGLLYDTGALLAAERRNRSSTRLWLLHEQCLRSGVRPWVPVVVLAQAWRGRPAHDLSRLLRGCQVLPDTEELGRMAGRACALAGTADVVDALVVAFATRLGAPVVTSDPADLLRLASGLDVRLALHQV